MTPERRQEIEEEEALRYSLRAKQESPVEKWGCKYPLYLLLLLLIVLLAIGIFMATTGRMM